MTFLRSLNQQWEKSHLSQLLNQNFQKYSQINQFVTGATSLNAVTCMIAALVYSEGVPAWLPTKENFNKLSDEQVLNCLLITCQLLFAKALQENELSQCERLVFTLTNTWVSNTSLKNDYFCVLIKKICNQVDAMTLNERWHYKSMR